MPGLEASSDGVGVCGDATVVTIDKPVLCPIESLWVQRGATLNIDGDLTTTGARIGSDATVNQAGGTFTVLTGGIGIGGSEDKRGATYNLSGGDLIADSGEIIALGNTSPSLRVAGDGALTIGNLLIIGNGALEVNGGVVEARELVLREHDDTTTPRISVFGSNGQVHCVAFAGEARGVIEFTPDSMGVSAITADNLALGDITFKVNDSQTITRGLLGGDKIVLMKYKKAWGGFGGCKVAGDVGVLLDCKVDDEWMGIALKLK